MKTIIAMGMVFAFGSTAQAELACRSAAELSQSVEYCDDNFDYYDAAKECQEKYLAEVKVEQAKIKKALEAQSKLLTVDAQNKKMSESVKALTDSIDTLEYLAEYGKQVHSEIEDYVYELVLPAFDEQEGNANLEDPKVKAEFMKRECYGGPTEDMEALELEMRPVIADLEKTKDEAIRLRALTGADEGNLGSIGGAKAASSKAAEKAPIKAGKSKKSESTITGVEEDKAKRKK